MGKLRRRKAGKSRCGEKSKEALLKSPKNGCGLHQDCEDKMRGIKKKNLF